MQRYDFDTDEACTYIRFRTMEDGEYVKYDEAMQAVVELAYAMNDIVNMKRELKKTYDLISHHAGKSRMFEGFWSDAKELLKISGDVAKETGRPTLAFRIKCLLERPV